MSLLSRRYLLFLRVFSLAGMAMAAVVGLTWTGRLSSHGGFHQVSVSDPLARATDGQRGPRRAVLVVLDGLGYEEAQAMRSLAQLAREGQCRKTYVGAPSMSRPVYAVLSTGLEQDRTGARANDDTSPLTAESIWDVARRAGLSVSAVSELPWWQQLFPQGFSDYLMPPRGEDYFRLARPADLMLIHPLYIDDAGHDAGAGSAHYRKVVERADTELEGLLATLDRKKDLIIVTADHGHSLSGGHGGGQPRVSNVLTCYAGVGVRQENQPGPMQTTSIAPSLALLLRLPFPANMRAGEDDLDVLWQIADPAAFPAGYLDERKRTVEHFRAENSAALRRWLPEAGGSWSAFYDWHRQRQRRAALRWLGSGALVVLFLAFVRRRMLRRERPEGPEDRAGGVLFAGGWMALVYGSMYTLQVGLRGSFDLTSVGRRAGFIGFTMMLSVASCLGGGLLHVVICRRRSALLRDVSFLLVMTMVMYLAHSAALGWKMGFPQPGPEWVFFAYFTTLFLGCLCCLGLILTVLPSRRTDTAARGSAVHDR